MSDERNPVMCRCGEEMRFVVIEREASCGEAPWFGYYTCDCGWMAPSREGDTPEDCERNAYAAATATPPNLRLTREQVEALDDLDAVWVDEMGCKTFLRSGEWAKEFLKKRNLQGYCMFKYFACKPTPSDIAAARKDGE